MLDGVTLRETAADVSSGNVPTATPDGSTISCQPLPAVAGLGAIITPTGGVNATASMSSSIDVPDVRPAGNARASTPSRTAGGSVDKTAAAGIVVPTNETDESIEPARFAAGGMASTAESCVAAR